MARKGTRQKPRQRQSELIGDSEQPAYAPNAATRYFLLAFELKQPSKPYAESEFGPDGPADDEYVGELRRWFREEYASVRRQQVVKEGYILFDGVADYESLGFPSGDTGQIRTGIRQALQGLLVQPSGEVAPIVTTDAQCRIEVSYCNGKLVERYVELWKAAFTGSSPGRWNRTSVSSPWHEETVMAIGVDDVVEQLERLDQEAIEALEPVVEKTQRFLRQLEGKSFGSLTNNQRIAKEIQQVLNRLDRRLACPRENCGKPATIECRSTGNTKHGSFLFRHRRNGGYVTHSGSVKLPVLTLVAAPPTVRRKVHQKKN